MRERMGSRVEVKVTYHVKKGNQQMRNAPMMMARVLAAFRSRFNFLSILLPRSPRSEQRLIEFVSVFSVDGAENGE